MKQKSWNLILQQGHKIGVYVTYLWATYSFLFFVSIRQIEEGDAHPNVDSYELTVKSISRNWTFHWMHLPGAKRISKILKSFMKWPFFLMVSEKLLTKFWMHNGRLNGVKKRLVTSSFMYLTEVNGLISLFGIEAKRVSDFPSFQINKSWISQ